MTPAAREIMRYARVAEIKRAALAAAAKSPTRCREIATAAPSRARAVLVLPAEHRRLLARYLIRRCNDAL